MRKKQIPSLGGFSIVGMMLVGLIGCGENVSTTTGSYGSPEEVFAAAQAAGQKKDYKTICGCMTPESQEVMAGTMVMAGSMMKAFGGMAAGFGAMAQGDEAKKKMEEMKQNLASIDVLMKKHGVTDEAMKKIDPMQGPPENPVEVMKELASAIQDKQGFIAEMMALMESLNEGDPGSRKPSDMFKGKLVDLSNSGETAKGIIVSTQNGLKKREDVVFKKIGGSWLFDLTTMMKNKQEMAPAPMPGQPGGRIPSGAVPGEGIPSGNIPGGAIPDGSGGRIPGGTALPEPSK